MRIIPYRIQALYHKYRLHRLKNRIITYLRKTSEFEKFEKEKIIDYLTKNPIAVFPYEYTKKYKAEDVVVYTDDATQMPYVLHENKRLYFKKSWTIAEIQVYYNDLLEEQDIDSPHRYETAVFCVKEGDVVVDAGVAEGNFALSIVEKAKKIYLFEVDEEWIEVLKLTFAPWKDKVEIICKYVSYCDEDNNITLDTFFGNEKINFIKADIEGMEVDLLKGSRNILSNSENLKVVLCTYHREYDAKILREILSMLEFTTEFSKGYMIFIYNDTPLTEPYLRKGIIRGKK